MDNTTDDNYCYFCDHPDATGVPISHLSHCRTFEDLPEWEAEAAGIDRRSTRARRWNFGFLLARIVALAVEPLLFYALTTGRDGNTNTCVYMDSGFAAVVTVAATCLDAVHMVYIWRGPLKRQPTPWFDVFFLLPVLQGVFWLRAPKLIREQNVDILINTMISIFLLQFLSKAYLCFCMMRRRQKVTAGHIFFFFDKFTGHIFGAIGLSLIAYFIASHVAGACWYLLAGACWNQVGRWLGVSSVLPGLSAVVHLFSFQDLLSRKSVEVVGCLWWMATVWCLWICRNQIVFEDGVADVGEVVLHVKRLSWDWFRVCCGSNLVYGVDSWLVNAQIVVQHGLC